MGPVLLDRFWGKKGIRMSLGFWLVVVTAKEMKDSWGGAI